MRPHAPPTCPTCMLAIFCCVFCLTCARRTLAWTARRVGRPAAGARALGRSPTTEEREVAIFVLEFAHREPRAMSVAWGARCTLAPQPLKSVVSRSPTASPQRVRQETTQHVPPAVERQSRRRVTGGPGVQQHTTPHTTHSTRWSADRRSKTTVARPAVNVASTVARWTPTTACSALRRLRVCIALASVPSRELCVQPNDAVGAARPAASTVLAGTYPTRRTCNWCPTAPPEPQWTRNLDSRVVSRIARKLCNATAACCCMIRLLQLLVVLNPSTFLVLTLH
jgi:hypothetical protein